MRKSLAALVEPGQGRHLAMLAWSAACRTAKKLSGDDDIADIRICGNKHLMSHLTFRYKYDGTPSLVLDDFGWLEMQVVSERRSGTAGYWVQWQDVKDFVETLARYPIEADRPLSVEWGYSEKERHERVLAVEIAPANARGDLVVRVELADHLDPTDHIKTSFYTNYPNLTAFQIELASHMDGEAEQACLRGR